MSDPFFFLSLFPGENEILCVFDDHVIATIGNRLVDGFVLSLQEGCNAGGQTTNWSNRSIKEVPSFAISKCSLIGKNG